MGGLKINILYSRYRYFNLVPNNHSPMLKFQKYGKFQPFANFCVDHFHHYIRVHRTKKYQYTHFQSNRESGLDLFRNAKTIYIPIFILMHLQKPNINHQHILIVIIRIRIHLQCIPLCSDFVLIYRVGVRSFIN